MEDSTEMTIDFLRARLLSERSVSKAAREKVDQLTNKVSELEEQLKLVSVQRKEAEKATVEVLAILKSYKIDAFSEDFDSSSDKDVTINDSQENCISRKVEASINSRSSKSDTEDELVSSNHGSSPTTGRSLSWKGCKSCNGHKSHEWKNTHKRLQLRQRSNSTLSNGVSQRQYLGKSCRQIKQREIRDKVNEELIPLGPENGDDIEFGEGNLVDESKIFGGGMDDRAGINKDGEMEKALEHQARLIGQYEAEESIQREWEEKFIENNGHTQDTCENGDQSDITEDPHYDPVASVHERESLMKNGSYISQETTTGASFKGFSPICQSNCDNNSKVFLDSTVEQQLNSTQFNRPGGNFHELGDRNVGKKYGNEENTEFYGVGVHENSKSRPHLSSFERPLKPGPPSQDKDASKSDSQRMIGQLQIADSQRTENQLQLKLGQNPNDIDGVFHALHQAKDLLRHKLNESSTSSRGTITSPRLYVESDIPHGVAELFRLPTKSLSSYSLSHSIPMVNHDLGLGLTRHNTDMGHHVVNGDRYLSSALSLPMHRTLNPYLGHYNLPKGTSASDAYSYPYIERTLAVPSSSKVIQNSSPDPINGISKNDTFSHIDGSSSGTFNFWRH